MDSKTKGRSRAAAIQSGVAPNEIRKVLRSRSYAVAKRRIFKNSNGRWLTLLRPLPGRPVTSPEEIEPLPSVAEQAEVRRMSALRAATREFHRLATQERMNAKLIH